VTHPNTIARETVLQFLYMCDVAPDNGFSDFGDFCAWLGRGLSPEAYDFAERMATAVLERKDEIDAEIGATGSRWDLGRMAVVDRNVIRMGVVELRSGGANYKVVINEAVELARKYGDAEKSPKFVNGILDSARKRGKP